MFQENRKRERERERKIEGWPLLTFHDPGLHPTPNSQPRNKTIFLQIGYLKRGGGSDHRVPLETSLPSPAGRGPGRCRRGPQHWGPAGGGRSRARPGRAAPPWRGLGFPGLARRGPCYLLGKKTRAPRGAGAGTCIQPGPRPEAQARALRSPARPGRPADARSLLGRRNCFFSGEEGGGGDWGWAAGRGRGREGVPCPPGSPRGRGGGHT